MRNRINPINRYSPQLTPFEKRLRDINEAGKRIAEELREEIKANGGKIPEKYLNVTPCEPEHHILRDFGIKLDTSGGGE